MVTEVISVKYQTKKVGALSYDPDTHVGAFQYDPKFINSGLQLSPIMMPLNETIYSFPALNFTTFKGLPGLIADSLPDDFGNAVLNAWVARNGKRPSDITPLERLQYTGNRGMGALEYHPVHKQLGSGRTHNVALNELVRIAQEVLDTRNGFHAHLQNDGSADAEAMRQLLQVGMSAGGARPKAVLAFNKDFTVARSGQANVPNGFTHYLMKFDGVSEHNSSKETFGDPMGFGAMEFTYYLMAKKLDIDMSECRLLQEGERRHFITKRFDRDGNDKIHTQTLNAMAHVDYKQPGSYSYHELFDIARQLKLTFQEAEQILRRMIFNIVTRNHDDHSKNWAFCMSEKGKWSLAPAYDLAYSYKPGSSWVNSHWMTLNGKRDNFDKADLMSISTAIPRLPNKLIQSILDETVEVASNWSVLAKEYDVPASLINEIRGNLRLKW